MKTFEPSAKAIALREYQEAWTAFCKAPQRHYFLYLGRTEGAAAVARALGATIEELTNIRNIAERIINFEEEKTLQG
ncbi:MAG: hypothetical protein J6N51_13710 [Selenomonas sp.]|nr:hypothetical protein [Selenomonas sp.]